MFNLHITYTNHCKHTFFFVSTCAHQMAMENDYFVILKKCHHIACIDLQL